MSPLEHSLPETVSPKPRLLVGESNPYLREFLMAVLRADGYEVVATATADDLLDTLSVSLHPEFNSGAFDLVIAEISLFGRIGLSALDRFNAGLKAPPLVLIGGAANKERNAPASQSPAIAMLDDPVDLNDLRHLVRRLLYAKQLLS
jgi:DNA-binding NtrC family response regulator